MGDLVLGIETATDVCAVGLVRGDAVLAAAAVHVPRSHATRLARLVDELLAHARLTPSDLDVVAVSAGPGSYTGLRIGASLARGLCLATGARLVGVPTMAALAAEAADRVRDGEALVVALPSRRGELYLDVAGRPGAGTPGAGTPGDNAPEAGTPEAVALTDAGAWLDARLSAGVALACAGPAAEALRDALAPRPARVLAVAPSGARIARLGATAPGGPFEPTYVGTFATPPTGRR